MYVTVWRQAAQLVLLTVDAQAGMKMSVGDALLGLIDSEQFGKTIDTLSPSHRYTVFTSQTPVDDWEGNEGDRLSFALTKLDRLDKSFGNDSNHELEAISASDASQMYEDLGVGENGTPLFLIYFIEKVCVLSELSYSHLTSLSKAYFESLATVPSVISPAITPSQQPPDNGAATSSLSSHGPRISTAEELATLTRYIFHFLSHRQQTCSSVFQRLS